MVEMLVSCLLLSLCAFGFFSLFVWIRGVSITSQRQTQAINFAKETMEELLLKDYSDPELSVGEHTTESFLALPEDSFMVTRSYLVEPKNPEGKQITVSLTWGYGRENIKQESLCTLIIP